MKKFFTIFFVTLGVIFLLLIIAAVCLFIIDPLNLRSVYFNNSATPSSTDSAQGDHPYLSESQEKALRAVGVDPASLPSEITPEQEACFESKLGEARVAEIKSGDSPTMNDYFQAKDCI